MTDLNSQRPTAEPSQAPRLTFSRALVRRIATYVRGFYAPPPSGTFSAPWNTCQMIAGMIEAQEHALIESTPLAASKASDAPLDKFHRYTITGEGASPGYFRLVEDPAGAWVTWAEVEARLRGSRPHPEGLKGSK